MGIDYNKAKVKRLQTQLSNLGLYEGEIDGNYDNVSDVVAKYQKDNGIDISNVKIGELNQSTWDSIMNDAPTISVSPVSTGSSKSDLDEANATLNALRDNAPGNFSFSGQSQLKDLWNQINTFKDFSFDLNGDALYDQYRDQYIKQGKLAMMDTVGQAQAMTGGYGNSFAQSAGQQAYNAQLENLDDIALDLYTQAYNRYQDERSALYDKYSLLSNERDAELEQYRLNLSKYYDDLAVAQNNADTLSERAYQDEDIEAKIEDAKIEAVNTYIKEQEAAAAKEQELEKSTSDIVEKLDLALSMQGVVNIYGSKGVAVAAAIDKLYDDGNGEISKDEAEYLSKKYSVTEKDLDDLEALKKKHGVE